ncbi:NAD(P)H-binding protein [Rhodococcus sp. IEGM 1379]|uniref:NAD(P)H-binding protein n=1 Tax=Rhodococcus sp. IEGM 1379 TaxID=3047086 RepID=UPI0024B79C10|nr:NAD(P)H-binding protein [Rhodococcus sp. IEGM 1379]MDI9916639.1 NAD(P)H-binding protein [Rhodococcus sp. IEGM 1379]
MTEHRSVDERRVAIAGGHGKIAQHLTFLLAGHGDRPIALIRNPAHEGAVRTLGAFPVVVDLESATVDEVAKVLAGSDVAVFAAGAGPGSGISRKDTVDRAAAILFADAAEKAGVRRFIQISAMGAGEPAPAGTDDVFASYLEAKTAAEEDLRGRTKLDWTILRPGLLTDDDPSGEVTLAEPPVSRGAVTRADVAAVIEALIDAPASIGKTLVLTSGPDLIRDAVDAL